MAQQVQQCPSTMLWRLRAGRDHMTGAPRTCEPQKQEWGSCFQMLLKTKLPLPRMLQGLTSNPLCTWQGLGRRCAQDRSPETTGEKRTRWTLCPRHTARLAEHTLGTTGWSAFLHSAMSRWDKMAATEGEWRSMRCWVTKSGQTFESVFSLEPWLKYDGGRLGRKIRGEKTSATSST